MLLIFTKLVFYQTKMTMKNNSIIVIKELTENDDVADIYETGILPDEDDDEE